MPLFTNLKPKPRNRDSATCLLLDTSGSMASHIVTEDLDAEDPTPRAIEVLFKAVRETPECNNLKAYTFNSQCQSLEVIPTEAEALNFIAHGSTDLSAAFQLVKRDGFYNVILVTDGAPDSEASALNAAYGMKLGIIYIGPPPVPEFLQRLASATDGTFALADMRDLKQLEDAIVRALPPPTDTNNPGGAINL